jgi:hypothetical protein
MRKQMDTTLIQPFKSRQPHLPQFARAISEAARRTDEAFMRQVFDRHATDGKLSAGTLSAALKDVAAPVFAATSCQSSPDPADCIFCRADANMSGDVDFSE